MSSSLIQDEGVEASQFKETTTRTTTRAAGKQRSHDQKTTLRAHTHTHTDSSGFTSVKRISLISSSD